VQVIGLRPRVVVSADGARVVSHAGSRLLADLADRSTLTGELSHALRSLLKPRVRRPRDDAALTSHTTPRQSASAA